ncbi:Transposase, Ptta/En/Spm, plant, partial [Corchorus capsularis]
MVRAPRSLKGLTIVNGSIEIGEQSGDQPTSAHDEMDTDTEEEQTGVRGKTTMAHIWAMGADSEKILIEVDEFGVPCTKNAATFASFLGVIAKNGVYVPLNIPTWRHDDFTPYKLKCLKLLEEKFEFPHTENTVDWILKNLNKRWRDWKGSLKATYYIPKGKQRVLSKPPKSVLEEQWPGLVRQWYDPRKEELAQINKINARKQNNAHTCGRKSFARIRNEM